MLLNNIFVFVFLIFLYFSDIAQSRVIKITDIPIQSDEIVIKLIINNDTSSPNVGKLFIIEKGQDEHKIEDTTPEPSLSFTPDLDNRVGINGGKKCAKGYKMNVFGMCKPVKTVQSK